MNELVTCHDWDRTESMRYETTRSNRKSSHLAGYMLLALCETWEGTRKFSRPIESFFEADT